MSPAHKCIRKDDTLRLTLDLVRTRIDSRIAEIRRERNMLIPLINGLPTELLSGIFLFSVEKPEVLRACSVKGHAGLRCDDNPTVLTEVCFHWRTVAISTPGVWSLLCSRFRIGRIKCFLARSKNYPLDIWCHPAHHEQFIPLILPHLSRWQTFTSWSPYILDNVDRLFQYTPAPLLTEFMLERGARIRIKRGRQVQYTKFSTISLRVSGISASHQSVRSPWIGAQESSHIFEA
ncbi:hypothetical protein FRC03_010599 [Tulasnella sp. 419]|nr:hypothetical protein FRC03_010599 [Tulasnella sp. 419]